MSDDRMRNILMMNMISSESHEIKDMDWVRLGGLDEQIASTRRCWTHCFQ